MRAERVTVAQVTYGDEQPKVVSLACIEIVLRFLNLHVNDCSTSCEPLQLNEPDASGGD